MSVSAVTNVAAATPFSPVGSAPATQSSPFSAFGRQAAAGQT